MKNRVLKKLMILGMSFSMAVSMVPGTAFAAEGEPAVTAEPGTEPQTQATEPQTQATEPQTQATELQTQETESETKVTEATEPQTEATEPQTQATEPQTQVTEPATEETEPVTEATEPTTEIKSSDKKAKALTGVTDSGTPQLKGTAGTDYVKSGSDYEIKGKVTMTLDACKIGGTVTVEDKAELTIIVTGGESVIASVVVAEGGKVFLDKSSTGMLKSDITVSGMLDIQGGTLIKGTSEADSLQVNGTGAVALTGGSIAYKTTVSVKDSTAAVANALTAYEITTTYTEKKPVEITSLKVNGTENTTYGKNGIFTGTDGKLFLYLPGSAAAADVTLEANIYDIAESANKVSGKVRKCKGNGTALTQESTEDYEVAVGRSIQMTYGTLPEAESPVSLKNAEAKLTITKGDTRIKLDTDKKKIQVTEAKLIRGTYKAEVEATDKFGFKASGEVQVIVATAELTAEVESVTTKKYDGKKDAEGKLGFDKVVSGDTINYTATFAFTDANAGKDITVKASDIKLDSSLSDKYSLKNTSAEGKGTIEKAPCAVTPEKPEFYITYTFDKDSNSWKYYLRWKALPGQEYSTNEKSWKLNNGSKTKTYMLNVDGKESVTIYTRVAETNNYEMSKTVKASSDIHTPLKADTAALAIEGIEEGENYKTNSTLKFKAIGASPDVEEKDLSYGDERYLPYSWKLTDTTVWSEAPYTGTIEAKQNGTYTVVFSFHRYVYGTDAEGNMEWIYDPNGDIIKKVVFKVSSSGKTVTTTPGGTTTTKGTGTTSKTNTAAKTADTTPVLPAAGAFAVSGLAACYLMRRKKKYSK